MKKKVLPLLAFLLTAVVISNTGYAAGVDYKTAETVAFNFYNSNSDKVISVFTLADMEIAADGSPAYYVFNVNNSDGFVIVSADDAALPIIGYATSGHFNSTTSIPPLAALLKNRVQQISFIKGNKLRAVPKINAQWQKWLTLNGVNTRSTEGAVAPLCTSAWNQQTNFNALCPGGSPTGCTATTMAQIMKYWKFPLQGTGSVTYNDNTSLGFTENYGVQSADFGNTTYDWAAMPDTLRSVNLKVDSLIYQCAVSIYTDFNPINGSSANVVPFDSLAWKDPYGGAVCAQQAFSKYFGYDSASMRGLQKADYIDAAWDSIMENELNNNRIIQYAGYTDTTKQEGHTWVCDGYDVNNNFHMNWGWGGDYDGYFALDALYTDIIYDFNYAEEALIGIQPAQSVPTAIKEPGFQNDVSIYPNPTRGQVYIYSAQAPVNGIEVYDMVGDKIFQSTGLPANKSSIDLTSLPAGVYFICLQGGEGMVTSKLVKE